MRHLHVRHATAVNGRMATCEGRLRSQVLDLTGSNLGLNDTIRNGAVSIFPIPGEFDYVRVPSVDYYGGEIMLPCETGGSERNGHHCVHSFL